MIGQTERERVVKKFRLMSEQYHKMSLLFYELSQSLNIELREIEHSRKKIKVYLKDKLNLDYDKVIQYSSPIKDLSIENLKGGKKNGIK
jgi:hypothetical protein